MLVASLKPYPNNPRKNDAAVDAVAKSIAQFGFRQPIVVDRDLVVIVGHTRLEAAKRLGIDEVPVHVAHDMSDDDAKAYRILDNKTSEYAEWDVDLLGTELGELALSGIYSPDFFGFDSLEIPEPKPEAVPDPDATITVKVTPDRVEYVLSQLEAAGVESASIKVRFPKTKTA